MSKSLFRTCPTTGLKIDLQAQALIKANAVAAVVFLAIGGLFGLSVALTRWPEVHLLPADWFYLALFPLFDLWPLGRVWTLMAAGTLLLALLPWLPPKRRGSAKAELDISVHPDNRTVRARFGETILDAGLPVAALISVPFHSSRKS